MNRRLNPDIFDSNNTSGDSVDVSYSAVASRRMEKELKETQRKLSQVESLVEVLQSQISQMNRNTEQRTDAFSKALSELEREIREQNLTQSRRINSFEERFRDQNVKDGQMESMVERFNSNLLQFENRLTSLQKVISEKEMTLLTYRQIMEKIVDEVEKLKTRRPLRPMDL